jgi:uroporphyrinogen-III synthase
MILLTRPLENSLKVQSVLHAHGYDCWIEPLLTVSFLDIDWPNISTYDALIATSVYAVEAIYTAGLSISKPIWCVGRATEKRAADYGYKTHVPLEENATSLARDIVKIYGGRGKRFLYPSAEQISVDIPSILAQNKISCDRLIVYKTEQAQKFSTSIQKLLQEKKIKYVLLYSQRTAESFKVCVTGQEDLLQEVSVLCKSKKILQMVDGLPWQEKLVFTDSLLLDVFKKREVI